MPVGLALFFVLLVLPPPEGMPVAAWRVVAVGLLMAFWWVTEVLPVAATALLPVILFPLFGAMGLAETVAPFADPVIFLFLGGLLLGLALQKCGLHRRIALRIVSWVGLRPGNLLLGFMGATAFLSMWVSNTATAMMMLPIGQSIAHAASRGPGAPEQTRAFGTALMLGIAYAATIGGMGTLHGAVIGAALFLSLEEVLSHVTEHWRMIFGPLLILVVLFARGGIAGLIDRIRGRPAAP